MITHLARLRKDAGVTQAQLAETVGVSRKTINTVENRVFTPSTLLALKLARALGVTVEALFELEDGD
ncbi:putative transcriptional regulator [Albimonas donghaensis]|uniref:Putative transcriptional regulator n=1 Tax=Albimonas donghaensis TaxID=356660 RepID=A0A1H2ZG83_9RHOB|nr:helix-turn-helix domain-containing protein [Albimonas donghaensis]MAS42110.1 helix-turn-helix domain-containing protein [Paracoccaceae bacterium]SDX16430.1 putative transcriptional regulator [Albimonas donghaensis]